MARLNTVSPNEFIEINPLILNTLNLVRGQIEKRGIAIKLELEDKLPLVRGSSIYFQQILLNFILHSKKQIEHNGSMVIRSFNWEDQGIQIELEDSGNPMPAEYIEKILDPFGDLDNSAEMNLGLTVSIQMVRDIGGHIKIESRKKVGNKIIIQIPKFNQKEGEYDKEVVSTG